jgi:hypothetical protein
MQTQLEVDIPVPPRSFTVRPGDVFRVELTPPASPHFRRCGGDDQDATEPEDFTRCGGDQNATDSPRLHRCG